jgi:hypothetical protein
MWFKNIDKFLIDDLSMVPKNKLKLKPKSKS